MQGLHGFIKLHRSLLHWGWYKDPAVKSLFLLLKRCCAMPKMRVGNIVKEVKKVNFLKK